MQWGNGYIDLIGKLGQGLTNSAFQYGVSVVYTTLTSGQWVANGLDIYHSMSDAFGSSHSSYCVLISPYGPGGGDLAATVNSVVPGHFHVSLHNFGGSNVVNPGLFWMLVRGPINLS